MLSNGIKKVKLKNPTELNPLIKKGVIGILIIFIVIVGFIKIQQSNRDKAKSKVEKSTIVGISIAEKMKKANIKKIIFDRNGYKYHGRIKAVGDAIRDAEIQI